MTDNATLTIEPGAEVRFAPDRGLVVSSGQLIARGTETEKIHFHANADGEVTVDDRWAFIAFGDASVDASIDNNGNYLSGSVLEHTIVEHAGGVFNRSAVDINRSSATIEKAEFQSKMGTGCRS